MKTFFTTLLLAVVSALFLVLGGCATEPTSYDVLRLEKQAAVDMARAKASEERSKTIALLATGGGDGPRTAGLMLLAKDNDGGASGGVSQLLAPAPAPAMPPWLQAVSVFLPGGLSGGTSGATAPIHTAGQAVDGTVCWEFQATAGLAGVPVGLTLGRSTGAASSAEVATSARADGLLGNECTISINPSTDASTTFQHYPSALGGALADANFSANDAIYMEFEVTVDCGSGLYYSVPDLRFRFTTSAYAGTYQFRTVDPTAGIATHCTGKFTALFRSPILDTGASNIAAISGNVAVDGARTGGSGFVNVTRRNQAIRKYNKSAVGAVTW